MNKKVQRYSTKFKAEATKKIVDNSANLNATAQPLVIALSSLFSWHKKINQSKLISIEPNVDS